MIEVVYSTVDAVEGPEDGDIRVTMEPGCIHPEWFVVERYQNCPCPDCLDTMHWIEQMATTDRERAMRVAKGV